MSRCLMVVHSGFELIETIAVLDVFRALKIETDLCSVEDLSIKSFRDLKVSCDITFDEIKKDSYDCLVFPGGPSADELMKNKKVLKLAEDFYKDDKIIGAICGAPQILSQASILADKRATSHPKLKDMICCREYSTDSVVVDGKVVTSRAPGTALEFAFTLGEFLADKKLLEETKQGFLYQ